MNCYHNGHFSRHSGGNQQLSISTWVSGGGGEGQERVHGGTTEMCSGQAVIPGTGNRMCGGLEV